MFCPYCGEAAVSEVQGDDPWTPDHFQCSECNSTYLVLPEKDSSGNIENDI